VPYTLCEDQEKKQTADKKHIHVRFLTAPIGGDPIVYPGGMHGRVVAICGAAFRAVDHPIPLAREANLDDICPLCRDRFRKLQ
jgi:hypothetical protein